MNSGITIKELYLELQKQMHKGNGSKKILITTDDEGNGCHELFFGISETKDFVGCHMQMPYHLTDEEIVNNYVLLG